jgi:hypothetical protein
MKHQKIGECQDSPSVDKNVSGLVRASDRYLSPAADDCCTGFLGPTDIQSRWLPISACARRRLRAAGTY